MKVARKFTKAGSDPYASVQWVKRSSKITNPDGSVVFEMKDAEVPETWSQLATDIMVSKYVRKAGVPQADGSKGPEKSARQVIHRLAGCWRHWGETAAAATTAVVVTVAAAVSPWTIRANLKDCNRRIAHWYHCRHHQ